MSARTEADWSAVADAVAGWRRRWAGRPVFRAAAGSGWLRINLDGDERPALLLTSLPGAPLILAGAGPLPDPLHHALRVTRNHPLTALLRDCVLEDLGVLPDDRVAGLRLRNGAGEPIVLLHQLFGSRGNTTLLDADARALWAGHRPPHSLLAELPPAATWSTGTGAGTETTDSEFAIDAYSQRNLERLADHLAERSIREVRANLGRRLDSARRLVANLERDLQNAERGDEYRRRAEALAARLHEIAPGTDSIVLTDPRDGSDLQVELDPSASPATNLDAFFRRARKAEKGRELIADRCATATTEAGRLAAALEQFEASAPDDLPPLDRLRSSAEWIADHADLLPTAPAPGKARGPEEPARPFRRYRLDGRWEVWVGRNNKENDALTFGASHGKDLWLHAQGVPGSHVILRTAGKPEQVPRAIIEKAAALAALHCRSKHSELVPVVWTERRYVRKPRKSPPGTAVCLREKSLFVTPKVPTGAEPI